MNTCLMCHLKLEAFDDFDDNIKLLFQDENGKECEHDIICEKNRVTSVIHPFIRKKK